MINSTHLKALRTAASIAQGSTPVWDRATTDPLFYSEFNEQGLGRARLAAGSVVDKNADRPRWLLPRPDPDGIGG